jgi:hypothetical protein
MAGERGAAPRRKGRDRPVVVVLPPLERKERNGGGALRDLGLRGSQLLGQNERGEPRSAGRRTFLLHCFLVSPTSYSLFADAEAHICWRWSNTSARKFQ